jgi:hypothetical protein
VRPEPRFHFIERHGGRGVLAMVSEALFHQGFICGRERRFIKFYRAANEELPLAKRQRGQFVEHFGKTHGENLVRGQKVSTRKPPSLGWIH